MKKQFFLLLFLGLGQLSFEQMIQSNNYHNMTPPSPSAASFQKQLDVSMNYCNGLPNISIPIQTVKAGIIEFPVSLSYTATGIRVEEAASNVGMGWNLSTGPSLTRSVRGLPDDSYYGFINSFPNRKVAYIDGLPYDGNTDPAGYSERLLIELDLIPNNHIDIEPDIYSFSILGYSGKFHWDQSTDKFVLSPMQNIVITPLPGLKGQVHTSFEITLPNGIKCLFGGFANNVETFVYQASASVVDDGINFDTYPLQPATNAVTGYITSWSIVSIVDPTGKTVYFDYSPTLSIEKNFSRNENKKVKISGSQGWVTTYGTSVEHFAKTNLTNIRTDEFNLQINQLSSLREDMIGDSRAIDNIMLYDNQANQIKKFQFNYEYTTSPEVPPLINGLFQFYDVARKRLWLKTVQEFTSISTIPPYEFFYNQTPLPSRLSNSQDYWGFYNGKHQNTEWLFPYMNGGNLYQMGTGGSNPVTGIVFDPYVNLSSGYYHNGADRRIDNNFSMAGMLTKIKYPTGGATEYTFEPNVVPQHFFDYSSGMMQPDGIDESVHFGNGTMWTSAHANTPFPYHYEEIFTITNPTLKWDGSSSNGYANVVELKVQMKSGCELFNDPINCKLEIKISSLTDPTFTPIVTSLTLKKCYKILPPGTYKIESNFNGSTPEIVPDFSVEINWQKKPMVDQMTVGGHRVKTIVSRDNLGNTIKKSFSYKSTVPETGAETNLSSGILCGNPQYVIIRYMPNYGPLSNPSGGSFMRHELYSNSLMPLTPDAQTVKYTTVTEYSNDNNTNGKTIYKYYIDLNYINAIIGNHDGSPPLLNEWKNNLLRIKEVYSKTTTGFKKISEDFFEYNFYEDRTFLAGLRGEGLRKYYLASEWFLPKSSVSTSYSYSGGVEKRLVTTTYNEYNSKFLLSSTVAKNSKGKTIENKMYYPSDYTNTNFNLPQLINKNIIQNPIKKEVLINGKQKTGNIFLYDVNGQPTDVFSYQNSNLVTPPPHDPTNVLQNDYRLDYHLEYNSNGDVVSQNKSNDIKEVYLYGYNHQYPVAKIVGSDYATASSKISQVILDNPTNDNALRTELAKLRTIQGALVTTYTYKPLVGVNSETDPQGKTIYYVYDDFNRLKLIRDKDNNILKTFEYKYQETQ